MGMVMLNPEIDVNQAFQDEYKKVLKNREERTELAESEKLTIFAHVAFDMPGYTPYLFSLNYNVSGAAEMDGDIVTDELIRLQFGREFLQELTSEDKMERSYALGNIIANIVTNALDQEVSREQAMNDSLICANIVKYLMGDVTLINLRIVTHEDDRYQIGFHSYSTRDPYPAMFIPIEMEVDPEKRFRLN